MRGKNLITKAYKLNETENTPWVPFVGVHAASLLGIGAKEYLQSADLIVEGVNKAIEAYNPDGIPVVFDLQLEAEALGCKLMWADDNPPSVISHPLTEGKLLADLTLPQIDQGRIGIVIEATKRLRAQHPDIALFGLITGPFTLALHLLGTEIFMKMFDDEQYVHQILEFCEKVANKMTDYYKAAGCDVIAVVDPMTSQIGPEQFNQFIKKYATNVFSHIKSEGLLSSFFVCGHAQHNIEVMCACKPDNISIDENIPLDYVRDICLANNISFGGNMKLTVVLLMGIPQEAEQDAVECMDIGGKRGFILSPGCDLAYATPEENLKAVSSIVHDTYRQDIVRAMEVEIERVEKIDLEKYKQPGKVIIDVITLDSASCAPCQYMIEAVKHAAEPFGEKVEWREHSIKTKEALTFMAGLGVKNIPTICINGRIEFVSNIPPINEIAKKITEELNR